MAVPLKDISLRNKLLITFIGFVAAIGLILLAHASTVSHVQDEIESSRTQNLPALLASRKLENSFEKIETLLQSVVVTGETALQSQIDSEHDQFHGILTELARSEDPRTRNTAITIATAHADYYPEASRLASRIGTGSDSDPEPADLGTFARRIASQRLAITEMISELVDYHTDAHAAKLSETHQFARRRLAISITVGLVAAIVFAGIFSLVARSIMQPINDLAHAAETVAQGNLDTEVPIDNVGTDELGLLTLSFQNMLVNLRNSTVSRDYFDSVIQSTADMLIVLESDYSVHMINRSVVHTLGYTEEDLLGKHVNTIIRQPLFDATPATNVSDALYDHVQVELITNNGKHVPAAFSSAPIRQSDRSVRWYVCIATDMTEQRRSAKQLEEAKEAALASAAAKSEFLANVSHEIRTPINGVLGMLTLLLETQLNNEQSDYTNSALASGNALLDLINDVLDFSKIEAGKLDLETIPFDIRQTVDELNDIIRLRAREKKLSLGITIDADIPELLIGDPSRLRQILLNLFSNALKFTKSGGIQIDIQLADKHDDGVTLEYSVTDTGIGIPAGKQSTLFSPFTQADSSTTRKYGGTGLGLSICHELVTQMGGTIDVRSAEGQGARFYFRIPHRIDRPPTGITTRRWASLPDLHALTAISDEQIQESVRELLLFFNVSFDAHNSLSTALDSISPENPPDLIFIDDAAKRDITDKEQDKLAVLSMKHHARIISLLSQADSTAQGQSPHNEQVIVLPARVNQFAELLKNQPQPDAIGQNNTADPSDTVDLGLRLLLVEDNVINQRVATGLLSKIGYTVDVAPDGAEAIELIQEQAYDLILMDCQMPVMDGYEATRRIRKMPVPTCNTPIIAMTANAMKGDREKCISAGMDDYVTKPINAGRMKSLIRSWITRGSLTGHQ